jgi:hypothetical protein
MLNLATTCCLSPLQTCRNQNNNNYGYNDKFVQWMYYGYNDKFVQWMYGGGLNGQDEVRIWNSH